ncbi:MAG: hypothetical protein ACAI18_20540, partial [Gemmatimonadales bacterium]
MTTSRTAFMSLCGALLLAACGDSSGPDGQDVDCSGVSPTALAVGEDVVLDATQVPCVQLPAAGPQGAEHLYVALSGQGLEREDGGTAGFSLAASDAGTA